MDQSNALSDSSSPSLDVLAEKYFGLAIPITDFCHIEETQHESYLGVVNDNKLSINQHIYDISKKSIC